MSRSTTSVIWKVIVGFLVAVLVLLLLAEFGLRWFIGNELRSGFRENAEQSGVVLEEDPTIGFGATPLVFAAVSGNIPEVEMTTPSTLVVNRQGEIPEISGAPAANITLSDLNISDPQNPIAENMVTTTEASEDFLLATVQRSMAEQSGEGMGGQLVQELIQITDIRSNIADGTLDVEFTNGAAHLNLRPVPTDGQLSFEATGASLFGFTMPEEVTRVITNSLQQGLAEESADLSIDAFEIIDGGVRIQVSGTNVNLSDVADSASAIE